MGKIFFAAVIVAIAGLVAGTAASAADNPLSPPAGSAFQVGPGYALADAVPDPVADPPPSGSESHLLWGYEAAFANARLFAYTFDPYSIVAQCVPTGPNIPSASNGRGVAFDPL